METIIEQVKYAVKYWWLHLIMGGLFIAMGSWVIATPLASYVGLSIFFSLLMFTSGIVGIIFSLSNRKSMEGWGWHLAGSGIDFILGIILLTHPEISMTVLPLLLAFWFMLRGLWGIGVSIEMSRFKVTGWWISLIFGILSIFLSFMIINNPLFGGMSIVLLTAITFFSIGLTRIFLSFKLRHIHKKMKEM